MKRLLLFYLIGTLMYASTEAQPLVLNLPSVKLEGPSEAILNSIDISFDGKKIVTGSSDKTARIWDAESGLELNQLKGHIQYINRTSFSPDGTRILTVSGDGGSRIWEVSTGKEILSLRKSSEIVFAANYSPSGTKVGVGLSDNSVRILDAATGRELQKLSGHTGFISAVTFSPDETKVLTSGYGDKSARIWDLFTGRELHTLVGHTDRVVVAIFSPDGKKILTASRDETARIWDALSGRELYKLSGHTMWINSARFSPDGSKVVTASNDKTAYIWEVKNGKKLVKLAGHIRSVCDASFSPDGSKVVTGSGDHTSCIWDVKTGQELARLEGHENWVIMSSFSPDGTDIITGSMGNVVRVWHLPESLRGSKVTKPTQPSSPVIKDIALDQPELKAGVANKIRFTLANEGKGAASGLKVSLAADKALAGLALPPAQTIASLDPGASRQVEFALTPGQSLPSGTVTLTVTCTEQYDFDADPVSIRVATQAFIAPEPRMVSHKFEPASLRPKQQCQLTYIIQNKSATTARQVQAAMALPENVTAQDELETNLGDLKPGESRTLTFAFTPTAKFSADKLSVQIRVKESFGRYGESQSPSVAVQRGGPVAVIDQTGNATVTPALKFDTPELVPDVDKDIPKGAKEYPDRYALVIGNENYSRFSRTTQININVPFAANDAATFRQYALKTLGIQEDNCFFFQDATAATLNSALQNAEDLIANKNGRAELFVYYAGHGIPNPEKGAAFLLPVDVAVAQPDPAFDIQGLLVRFGKLKAKRIIFILDACFSGTSRPDAPEAFSQPLLAVRAIDRIRTPQASGPCLLISACAPDQTSLPWLEKKHGILSYYLFQKLKETRGAVTYGDLEVYLTEAVNERAIKSWQKTQNPKVQSSAVSWQVWKVNE